MKRRRGRGEGGRVSKGEGNEEEKKGKGEIKGGGVGKKEGNEEKKGKFSLLKGACVYMLSSSGVQSLSSEKSRAFKSLSLGCHLDLNL